RGLRVAPQNPLDPSRLKFLHDADSVTIPAPDVHRTNEQIYVRIFVALLFQRFEQADLLRINTVTLGHGDVAAVIEKYIAQPPRVTELPVLGVPLWRDGEQSVVPLDVDGGVVRCFDDCHVSPFAVGCAPERHADAVAAIGYEAERLDGWVLDRIGNAFVHRHHEVFAGMRSKRMRELQGTWQLVLRRQFDC